MTDETKQVEVFLGPYRGNRLTMSVADADAAIGAHWARDWGTPYDTEHGELSDEERAAALEAATTWAHEQWNAGTQEPPPEPLPEGTEATRQRDLKPDDKPGGYATRQATQPQEPQPTPPVPPRRGR